MRNLLLSLFLFFTIFWISCNNKTGLTIDDLRCEYLQAPKGLDVPNPRLSWKLSSFDKGIIQTEYQVIVASSPNLLKKDGGDLWNAGKVKSNSTFGIIYKGKTLRSNQTYYWKVHVWNKSGKEAWSRVNTFRTGLFKKSDWKGIWISPEDSSSSAPLLRKEFVLKKKVKQATVYVTGVGYYELYLNGEKVGNHVLDPGLTNYRKRILYASYDVTNQLKKGVNAVGIILGNGPWYMHKQKSRYTYENRNRGPLRALLQLNIQFKDGSTTRILTDTSWRSGQGPITYNNFYGGEDYDARREQRGWSGVGFDDTDWEKVVKADPPDGILKSQMMPPIKVIKTIHPIKKTHPSKGIYLFDLGQNISGWWRIQVKGKRGVELQIRGAETLNDSLFPKSLEAGDKLSTKFNYHRQVYTDYTLNGDGNEIYEPRFFYTGFRYIEVKVNHPEALELLKVEGRVVQTALERTGRFSSSDSLLNKIHHATVWSIIGNTHSYPSDCPQREKGAYTGDGQIIAEAAIHDFNMAAFYTNWMADMHDAQFDNGKISNTAPTLVGGHGGGVPWGSAYILIPSWMYQYYGDKRLMKTYYASMKKYMKYLYNLACHDSNPDEKYIINQFGTYWYSLGEWCAPGQTDGPNHPVVSTAYWYKDVMVFAAIAGVLGKSKDKKYFHQLADSIKHAFNRKFLDKKTNLYGTKTPYQTYQLLALAFDLVPEQHRAGVRHQLIYDIKETRNNHLNTGILGTKYLFPVLLNSGHGGLAYEIIQQKTYPGYGYWIENGATTLWEKWSGKLSHNHQMFGSIDEYFYEYLAGIRAPTGKGTSVAYKNVLIKPYIPKTLKRVKASIETIRGEIESGWTHQGNHLALNIKLPANTTGEISIPTLSLNKVVIKGNGKKIWNKGQFIDGVKGISAATRDGKYVTFNVASGKYYFEVSNSQVK